MKKKYFKIKLTLIITLIINALISNLTLAKSKSFEKDSFNLLAKSNSEKSQHNAGTNTGHSVSGGARPESNCPKKDFPLVAIHHNQGSDLTVSPSPTFWFYVPYASNEINQIKFLLLDERERTTIFRALIQLNDKPGIIKITIPSQPEYALQENQQYRWRLNLSCKTVKKQNKTQEPDLSVNGWIRRVPIIPELKNELEVVNTKKKYIAYREYEIWHDAITNLAESHFADKKNHEFNHEWIKLLELLNFKKEEINQNGERIKTELFPNRKHLKQFAQKPLVDSKLLPKKD